ncbi:HNH endonuclease [Okeanomitos corallinicola TIOX110]|uniref:HNH endonuclease n=1 Tax=Okeanomitos corallinicola TIOX110 TaxID=3133117 RepID=A0ABZ2UNI9_9CYAN
MKARSFIKLDENVMVIFTDGTLLEFGDNNTGLTGDWKIDVNRPIDRVIIYQRDETKKNKLYIANHAGVQFVQENNRYKIKLAHVQYIGETQLNWYEFADAQAQPIRYLP